jgi:hypothetical protein
MKTPFKLGLIALVGAGSICANDVSRSYFNVRPYQPHVVTQNLIVDQATDTGRVLRMKGLEASIFVGQSTEAEELAKYFFFDGKDELIVREDDPGTDAAELTQDILSLNFNLDTTSEGFHSTIKVRPQQTFYGVTLSGRVHFRDKFWFAVEAPIIHVKNDMTLTENIVTTGGGTSSDAGIDSNTVTGTMKDAFKTAGMKYGKIDGSQSKTRLADLTLKFGYDSPRLNRKDLFMNMHVGIVLPTGNKAEGVYMFEPICGNGGHAAFMLGSNGQVHLRKFKDGNLWMSWGAQTQYLFQNTQKRSFDLKLNGPWSRYLSMFETAAKRTTGTIASGTWGINILTQDAKVTPGYTGTFDTGISYIGEKYTLGAGYSTFIRQSEKVELAKAWAFTEATIASYEFPAANNTNRFRGIGTEYVDLDQTTAATAIAIKEGDIDLGSAAHPASVSQMLQLTAGYHHPCNKRPYVLEAGASYEFSRQNTAMSRWGIWAKYRISF